MLVLALAFNVFTVALAFIGMMVVFMGGGGYLPVLILLLALSLPVSALMLAGGFAWFARDSGLRVRSGGRFRNGSQSRSGWQRR